MPGKKPFDGAASGLGSSEQTSFSLNHRHSGAHGDGQKIKASDLITSSPFAVNFEPTYTPVNNPTSGRKYRIQIIEVTGEDGGLKPVIQVIPA